MAIYAAVLLLAVFVGGSGADEHIFSKTEDFGGDLDLPQFVKEVVANATISSTLEAARTEGDQIILEFSSVLTLSDTIVLAALVAAHVPETPLEKICRPLPDTDTNVTAAHLQGTIVNAEPSSPRSYTMPTAAALIAMGAESGDLFLVNTGSSSATLLMGTGGTTTIGSMTVAAGASGHFRYVVTDYDAGSEAYAVIRIG
jgi:hypothetical protein